MKRKFIAIILVIILVLSLLVMPLSFLFIRAYSQHIITTDDTTYASIEVYND